MDDDSGGGHEEDRAWYLGIHFCTALDWIWRCNAVYNFLSLDFHMTFTHSDMFLFVQMVTLIISVSHCFVRSFINDARRVLFIRMHFWMKFSVVLDICTRCRSFFVIRLGEVWIIYYSTKTFMNHFRVTEVDYMRYTPFFPLWTQNVRTLFLWSACDTSNLIYSWMVFFLKYRCDVMGYP